MEQPLLEIKNLSSQVTEDYTNKKTDILKGVDLRIETGELHVLMGTNGSGKSTLANILAGHPAHTATNGSITFAGEDLLSLRPDERARLGLFLAFQYPPSIEGLPVGTYLRSAAEAVRGEEIPVRTFKKELMSAMDTLKIPKEFLNRSLNEGFSGGEKKRNEILQLNLLSPKLSVLDETDSGLDVDALKLVFNNIRERSEKGTEAFIIITHYGRVLEYLDPARVHIMHDGRIVKSGGMELSRQIEEEGFESVLPGEA
jgi:Fe-S cluster assembly ATP-binding protein